MIKIESNSFEAISKLEARTGLLKTKAMNGITKASLFLEGKMTEKISLDQLSPPLSPETVKKKKSSRILFDKGYLFQQIDHRVYSSQLRAEVGVFDGPQKRAYIALVHEYGAPEAGIPERSFMRSAYNENKKGLKKIFIQAAK